MKKITATSLKDNSDNVIILATKSVTDINYLASRLYHMSLSIARKIYN